MKGANFFLLLVVYLTVARDFERGGAYGKPGYGRSLSPLQPAWMSRLANDRRLFVDVTIPGTQESASYIYEGMLSQQLQSENITKQLQAGVRFLEITLVAIDGDLRVAHDNTPTVDRSVAFVDVLSEIQTFLRVYPTEVVIAHLDENFRRNKDDRRYTPVKSKIDSILKDFDEIIDRECKDSECMVNPSRGKLIIIGDGWIAPNRRFLEYKKILRGRQENLNLTTNLDLYGKWEQARDLLISSSSSRRTTGVINYFCASGGVLPYFVASGATDIDAEASLSTGVLSTCKDKDGGQFMDFPRKGCTGCGSETTCAIHFRGMNNMLYDWLVGGKYGHPQSVEVSYTWPQNLGILVLGFPDDSVLNEIIAVNFQTSNPWNGGYLKLIENCGRIMCPHNA